MNAVVASPEIARALARTFAETAAAHGLAACFATATASRRARASRWRVTTRRRRSRAPLADPSPCAALWSKLTGLPAAVPLRWFGRARYRTVAIDDAGLRGGEPAMR